MKTLTLDEISTALQHWLNEDMPHDEYDPDGNLHDLGHALYLWRSRACLDEISSSKELNDQVNEALQDILTGRLPWGKTPFQRKATWTTEKRTQGWGLRQEIAALAVSRAICKHLGLELETETFEIGIASAFQATHPEVCGYDENHQEVWRAVDAMLRGSKTVHRLGRIGAEFLIHHHEKAST